MLTLYHASNPDLYSLPSAVVDVLLQFPADNARDTMAQPDCPQQRIISLIVQEQLPSMSQSWINFSITIYVRGNHPCSTLSVEVEDITFAYVQVETYCSLAPAENTLVFVTRKQDKLLTGAYAVEHCLFEQALWCQ